MLFRADTTALDYLPEGDKFTNEELKEAVGGEFHLVASDNGEQVFVVNNKYQTNSLPYNTQANYLYRRLVSGDLVLKGDVLLCHRELLEGTEALLHSENQAPEGLGSKKV